jgi:hypothetical protein
LIIREKQSDISTRFQQDNRFVRIAGLDRSESRFFDDFDGKYPQQRFILHDKGDAVICRLVCSSLN